MRAFFWLPWHSNMLSARFTLSTVYFSETEGEFSPANSGVDPEFLRKIKRKTELNKLDQEVVRLIGQHLCDVGLRTSADVLMKEAGCRLDQPTAATFRHCVMKGDWTGAVNVLEELAPHLENPENQTEMRFLLLEQKYLEHLEAGNYIEALKVLQLELTPLQHRQPRTHALSAMLMQARPARSPPRQSGGDPRAEVMERLQAFLPPSVMLPPRRLTALLDQAAQHQQANCLFHNRRSDEGETFIVIHTAPIKYSTPSKTDNNLQARLTPTRQTITAQRKCFRQKQFKFLPSTATR